MYIKNYRKKTNVRKARKEGRQGGSEKERNKQEKRTKWAFW